jgi:CRP/FNR family transcriptional regulator, cyclic AMP receptor protein
LSYNCESSGDDAPADPVRIGCSFVHLVEWLLATMAKVDGLSDVEAFLRDAGGKDTDFRKDEVVFAQGDPADAVFYVRNGTVKLKVNSREGKEAVVGVLGPRSFVGEGCLTAQAVRMATAVAMDGCSVLKVDRTLMVRLLHEHANFGEAFLAHVLSRNVRIEADLVDQLFNSSEKRLARVLLLLANYGGEGEQKRIPKISQETLAAIVGTTRSRVSFFMNRFRELGFIHYNGGIEVHSSLLNIVLHD